MSNASMIAPCCREWYTVQKANQSGDSTKATKGRKIGVNDANSKDQFSPYTHAHSQAHVFKTRKQYW